MKTYSVIEKERRLHMRATMTVVTTVACSLHTFGCFLMLSYVLFHISHMLCSVLVLLPRYLHCV